MGEPNKTVALFGGEPIDVTLRDGTTEQVFVHTLRVVEFPRVFNALDDEEKLAEIFCAKPDGWAATLSPKSHEAVIEKGNELNSDFFCRWAQRRVVQRAKLAAGLTELPESPSPTGLPK
jgi:hypothetical protein